MREYSTFFGWRVAWAAFVVGIFGWGVGFYGPPVFLHAVVERTGWSITLVSSAVTVHFLCGAIFVANSSLVYERFGIAKVTFTGLPPCFSHLVYWVCLPALPYNSDAFRSRGAARRRVVRWVHT